jgi:capsular exopolysaccharide synthesis family protein
MNDLPEEPKPQRIWPILWRGKWLILASIVVLVGLAVAYTASQTKQYEATGIIQVNLPSSQPGSQDTTAANQGLAQNYAKLLVSSGFIKSIRGSVLHGQLSTDDIQSRLTATNVPQTALVQLQATGSSPGDAQTVAREVVDGFLSNLGTAAAGRTAQEQALLQQTINGLDTNIGALLAGPRTPTVTARLSSLRSTRNAVIAQNASLVANGVAQQTAASVSAAPVASSNPISPKLSLNLIAGLLVGILLGVGLAYLRNALRSGIQSAEDAAAVTDLPILASIPIKQRAPAEDPAVKEAYGVLYTNLLFSLHRTSASVVTVVGYNPQVGKSSVVQGLAEASVRSDRNMLIVDGDMRAAMLSKRLGFGGHPGLVDVLQGAVELDDTLIELRSGLSLLPTRESRVNPGTLLSGERMRAISATWRERFDVVIVDTPPIAGLADGLILCSLADAMVLVARAGVTKPAELTAATTSLYQTHTALSGLVVFEETASELYYPYGGEREGGSRRRDPAKAR